MVGQGRSGSNKIGRGPLGVVEGAWRRWLRVARRAAGLTVFVLSLRLGEPKAGTATEGGVGAP